MNNLRNHVQLIGNLGKDVEVKTFDSGKVCAQGSLATKEVYHNQNGEKVVDVQWHRIVAWGKVAESMEVFFKKGKEVAVKGKLRYRTFEGKDGKKVRLPEIIVTEFLLLR
ncbi:MAG: single-stranded DNA-binding protein [Bacteroidetes bacterium]|nr:MAG: single-stranded DNA-binding protein [Bacteroidota bacterium]